MIKSRNVRKIINIVIMCLMIITSLIFVKLFYVDGILSKQNQQSYDAEFSIEHIEKNNTKSLYNEVWIKGFLINGKFLDAKTFGIPNGWEEYAGFLHVYGFKDGKSILNIKVSDVESMSVIVAKNNSSGMICVIDGTQTQEIDLYSEKYIDEEIIPITIGLSTSKEQGQFLFSVLFCILGILLAVLLLINIDKVNIKRISMENKRLFLIKTFILVIIFTIIVILGTSREFPAKYDYNAEIIFTGDKTEISDYNVVWLRIL